MSNYTKSTNFTAKDALATGNPSKIVLGSEHDAEYTAIATAIATKIDDINSLNTETTIDTADFEVFYDSSAGSHKKITNVNKRRPILQIVHATDNGSSHNSTSYTTFNGSSVSITPISASSKILIEVSFHATVALVSAQNTQCTFRLYESTTGFGFEPTLTSALESLGCAVQAPITIREQVNSTGTTLRSFVLRGKTANSAIVSATKMVWTIVEYI